MSHSNKESAMAQAVREEMERAGFSDWRLWRLHQAQELLAAKDAEIARLREAVNAASEFIEGERACFVRDNTVMKADGSPDMDTLDDQSADILAEYDAALAEIRSALAPAEGDAP